MKKAIFSIFLLATVMLHCGKAVAKELSVEKARQNAAAFLSKQSSMRKVSRGAMNAPALTLAYTSNKGGVYVFNNSNGGYVLASGDDSTSPVLGYCPNGSFCYDAIPDGLRYVIEEYENRIEEARAAKATYETRSIPEGRHDIDTLVTAVWYQKSPYNDLCPIDQNEGKRSITGCVATGMAMVMRYHQWPETGFDTVRVTNTKTTTEKLWLDLSKSTYDWTNMLDKYDSTATEMQKTAVATLMRDAGYSVNMEYSAGKGGSAANDALISYALIHNFGYDKGLHIERALWYNNAQWDSLAYSELAEGRPLIFCGVSTHSGGHCFIIDGYETSEGFYHVNWGWNGLDNGYYNILTLQPRTAVDSYCMAQSIIAGMQKPCGTERPYITLVQYDNLLRKKTVNGHTYIRGSYENESGEIQDFELVAALHNKVTGEDLYRVIARNEVLLPADTATNFYNYIDIEDMSVPDGDYVMTMKCRAGYGFDEPISAGQLYDVRYDYGASNRLLLSVNNGVKTFSYPDETKSYYFCSFVKNTDNSPVLLPNNLEGKDFDVKARIINNGADRKETFTAEIGYFEGKEFSTIATSQPVELCLDTEVADTVSFVFQNLPSELYEMADKELYIRVHDSSMVIKDLEKLVLDYSDLAKNFEIISPIVCNEASNGNLAVGADGELTASFSGKIKVLQDMNSMNIFVVLIDTLVNVLELEGIDGIDGCMRSIYARLSENLSKDQELNVADWNLISFFKLDKECKLGDTVRLYVYVDNGVNKTLIQDPIDYVLTSAETDINNVEIDNQTKENARKLLINGRIIILQNGHSYSVEGRDN